MADYCCGLWCDGGTSPECLGLAADFCARFDAWVARYREHDDQPPGFDRIAYNEEGRALARELKQLVGEEYSVSYRYLLPADSADADLAWEEESIA